MRSAEPSSPPPWPCPGYSFESRGPWEWQPAGDEWIAGGQGLTCRALGCNEPAVMILLRKAHRWKSGTTTKTRWGCCAEHSYARVLYGGAVWEPCRPEDWDGTYTTEKGSSDE